MLWCVLTTSCCHGVSSPHRVVMVCPAQPTLVYVFLSPGVSQGLEEGCGGILSPVQDNLVDLVWADNRPPPPNSDLIILDIKYAGSC